MADAILTVFEQGASYSHQGNILTFCGNLLGQIGKKCTLRGAGMTPKDTTGGPRGKSFVYNQILLNFTPKVYYWISLKDLESDLKYFIFGPPPGIPVFLTGTPRGGPEG